MKKSNQLAPETQLNGNAKEVAAAAKPNLTDKPAAASKKEPGTKTEAKTTPKGSTSARPMMIYRAEFTSRITCPPYKYLPAGENQARK